MTKPHPRKRNVDIELEQQNFVITFPNLEAYDPLNKEWKMIIVSSRSQMKTRSKFDSGSGDGFGALLFLFLALRDPPS